MKAEIRIYYSPETHPVAVYSLKVALARKGVKVMWMWYPDKAKADVAILGLQAQMQDLLVPRGITLSFSDPVMTCGNVPDGMALQPGMNVPTTEIYFGTAEILSVL